MSNATSHPQHESLDRSDQAPSVPDCSISDRLHRTWKAVPHLRLSQHVGSELHRYAISLGAICANDVILPSQHESPGLLKQVRSAPGCSASYRSDGIWNAVPQSYLEHHVRSELHRYARISAAFLASSHELIATSFFPFITILLFGL